MNMHNLMCGGVLFSGNSVQSYIFNNVHITKQFLKHLKNFVKTV